MNTASHPCVACGVTPSKQRQPLPGEAGFELTVHKPLLFAWFRFYRKHLT